MCLGETHWDMLCRCNLLGKEGGLKVSEPILKEGAHWNRSSTLPTLDFYIPVTFNDIVESANTDDLSIRRTFKVDGYEFDVTIYPTGRIKDKEQRKETK